MASAYPWAMLVFMVSLYALVLFLLFLADAVEYWWVSAIFAVFGAVTAFGGYGAIQAFQEANNHAVWIVYGLVTLVGTVVSLVLTIGNKHKFAGSVTSTCFILYAVWVITMWSQAGIV